MGRAYVKKVFYLLKPKELSDKKHTANDYKSCFFTHFFDFDIL